MNKVSNFFLSKHEFNTNYIFFKVKNSYLICVLLKNSFFLGFFFEYFTHLCSIS